MAVSGTAARFADDFGFAASAAAAGLLHDIGKNSAQFQAYIHGLGLSPDHSTAGAVEAETRYENSGRILAFTIAGHHAGLADGASLTERLARKAKLPRYDGWEAHAGALPALADLRPTLPFKNDGPTGFSMAFLTRMLFSCLVDADRLETERFYAEAAGEPAERGNYRSLGVLRGRLAQSMAELAQQAPDTELNRLRAEILAHATAREALAPGLFTLTVPAGGGKTLASLSFALEHAVHHQLDRVIYVIPYTSIIEQTADVFRKALGAGDDILEHHGSFDWERAPDKVAIAEADGLEKLRRSAENWDAPVIVTTAVQFFESLFAARTSRCRKLHNLANSVIVLDEAQTLPLGLLRPCMAAIDELARNYGASIVLCTATQPARRVIDNALPPDRMKRKQGFIIGEDRELAPDPKHLYEALKRVTVKRFPEPVNDAVIAARFAEADQMLCIVNTRAHAQDLFAAIRPLPGARHLTTLMCPAHRRAVLAAIRDELANERPVRLVATSLIEAGVDVDFPEVWRAETGLDAIAQAAGRCNREGKRDTGRVVVFTPADHRLPRAFTAFRDAARLPLAMPDPLGLDAVHAYFKSLYFTKQFEALDNTEVGPSNGILPALERTAPDLDFPFASIADGFRMIDDIMQPVIVPWQPAHEEVKRLLDAIRNAEHAPAAIIRKLQQYTVGVPAAVRQRLLASGAVQVVNPKLGDRFIELISDGLYSSDTGLSLADPFARTAEENVF